MPLSLWKRGPSLIATKEEKKKKIEEEENKKNKWSLWGPKVSIESTGQSMVINDPILGGLIKAYLRTDAYANEHLTYYFVTFSHFVP